MGTEIEKKYRLTLAERERLVQRLREVGTMLRGEEFEENTLYAGNNLDQRTRVLRLRRVGDAALFTYKERYPSASAVKRQREDETRVENANALAAILEALGYTPALVYEKRRTTWRVADTEVVIDELPFGLFVEIEGAERAIQVAEGSLRLTGAEAEMSSYPELTLRHGQRTGNIIEARFDR